MRVYSPSSTEQFLQCPVWWALRSEWTPRRLNGPRDFARVLGRAFTAGMAVYHSAQQQTEATPYKLAEATVDLAVVTARNVAKRDLLELSSFDVSERDAAIRDAVEKRAALAVEKAIKQSPIPPEWITPGMLVEADLGEALGYAKPDLVLETTRGFAPLDYKLKLSIRGKSPQERERNHDLLVQDYELSWQMYHYCWALREFTGGQVATFFILLVTIEPRFNIELLPYEIDPESMELWKVMAQGAWERMEAVEEGRVDPVTFMPCSNRYGPCDCNLAVWKHHLDPALMEQDYIRRVRK